VIAYIIGMMADNNSFKRALGVIFAALATLSAAAESGGPWTTATRDGRVEASRGGTLQLAWQSEPLAKPAGGAKFAASAFLHPLRTPWGFGWTNPHPPDHLHHLGLWSPRKRSGSCGWASDRIQSA